MNVKERRLAQVLQRYRDVGVGDIMMWYDTLVVVVSTKPKGWRVKRLDNGKTFVIGVSIYTDMDMFQHAFRFVRDDRLF
jgi:hypothetical protein